MDWDVLVDGLARPEAPCDDGAGGLWFSDIAAEGSINHLAPDGRHRVVATRAHVGGIVPHVSGGIVASGPDLAVVDREGVVERVVLDVVDSWGFNDITTDSLGNVFAGLHVERPTIDPPATSPVLWRASIDGTAVECYGDLTMTNGMRVSPDGRRLYHADTLRRVVWVSDLDPDGLPRDRRVHHQLRSGWPDGMAIDEHECLWLAALGAGVVVRIAPDGSEDRVVPTPLAHVSAVCFAGSDVRDLVVTVFGGEPYDADRPGCVLTCRVDVAGLGLTPARV